MSQKGGQEYNILSQAKFSEHCSVLNCKELSCYDPDKKAIERAFRKRALKTHPDKGGDPVEFKKINDSYNRLIGHIGKLESQAEENELANSILIEISKTAVPAWLEKLKRVYGWHKSSDCKCIILEGPYKQFKGRSKNTGPITLVLYEDPPDGIPKIHVRSLKYMAWIAEQMLPVYMHVEKGRQIQFNQWRIAHIAEFGIIAHKTVIPTPAPQRKAQPEAPKETPKRKARDGSARRPKARRDSEPTETSSESKTANPKDTATNKENKEPENVTSPKASDKNGKADDFNPDEWEEIPEDTKDPFPKLYNMADQAFTKNGKKYRRKENKSEEPVKEKPKFASMVFNCGHCGAGFNSMIDYSSHSKKCIPDEDFGLAKDSEKLKPSVTVSSAPIPEPKETKPPKPEDISKATEIPVKEPENGSFDFLTGMSNTPARKSPDQPSFSCNDCNYGSESIKEYTKHKGACDKPPEVQKKKNVDDTLIDGKIIGKPAAKNNSEIPDTHSVSTDKKENIVPNEKKLDCNLSSKTNEHSNKIPTEKDSLKNNVSKPPKASKGNRLSSNETQPETKGKPLQNGKADIITTNDKPKNIHMDSLKQNLPPTTTKNSGLSCIMLTAILLITTLMAIFKCIQLS